MKRFFRFLNPLFFKCDKGSAAIETAIILPVFIFLVLGTVDVYNNFRAQSIVDHAASSIAQSLALQKNIYIRNDCNQADAICVYQNIAKDIYRPLGFQENGCVRITVVEGKASESNTAPTPYFWAVGSGWPVRYPSSALCAKFGADGNFNDLPDNEWAIVGDALIVVEAWYQYQPFSLSAGFWKSVGKQNLYSRSTTRPRYGSLVPLAIPPAPAPL